jgi:chromosome segregation protein
MRFEALHLERYGHFTGTSFEFGGDDVRLHIVHGRNEAGKSTILAAIADLLFGFPARTTLNFQHDYESLRIGATIVSKRGERLAFRRRKGNARTLRTEADQVLCDGALLPFLGEADRGLFERMFGLDHTRLREAGKRMLESDGDLGRSLFEAGSGIGGATKVLQSLQDELDAIGTPERRSAKKPLWLAEAAFTEAQRAKRERALRHDEFHAAEKVLAAAIAAKAKINAELGRVRERRSRLERIRRIGPILTDIDRLDRNLCACTEVPDLPPSFEADRLACTEACAAAQHAAETARSAHETLDRELEAIPSHAILTPFAIEIGALQTRLGEYLKGVVDEPKLARDVARFDEEIGRLLTSLGMALGPDEVDDRIPKKPLVARIRTAIREGDKLRATLERAAEEVARAQRDLAAAEEALAGLDGTVDPAAADALLAAVARHGDITAMLAKQRLEASKAGRALDEAARRLERWTGGIETLAATRFPPHETIRDYEQRLQALEIEKAAAARRLAEVSTELRDIAAAIETLEAAGDIPTTEAVAAERDRRDALWRELRRHRTEASVAVGGETDDRLRDLERIGHYETSVRRADELADRKVSEAQRIARFAELSGRRERSVREAADERGRLERMGRETDALVAAWSAAWAAIGMTADSAPAMRDFLRAKDETLHHLAEKRRTDADLALALQAEARVRDLLLSAAQLLDVTSAADLELENLELRVRAAAETKNRDWNARGSAEATARRARRSLQEKRGEVAALESAREAWARDWSNLVRDLSCAADAGPDEATAVLEVWDQIREPLTKRAETARRLDGLRADIDRFRDDLARLVAAIEQLAGERGDGDVSGDAGGDPKAVLQSLAPRLEREKLRLAKRADVETRRDAAAIASDAAERDLAAARAALTALRCRYDLGDTADLADLGRKAAEKRAIVGALRDRRQALAAASDGFDEHALREQCASFAPDAAEAEVAELVAYEDELVREGQAAAQAETGARQNFEALLGKSGAAEAEAEGRVAALAFAGHAERWLVLETARRLLLRAIERYRAENEHPMISRAGELLGRIAASAQNPIVRLRADHRDGPAPVIVGQRRDGRSCGIPEMSEGTRDQLFLCLRIAAIELYAKEREPLPFVADDLFVTSDDERVVPGLAALAELGRTTQVLLFTHHRHVVEAAETLPCGSVKVHHLAGLRERSVEPL